MISIPPRLLNLFPRAVGLLAIALISRSVEGEALTASKASQFFVNPGESAVLRWNISPSGNSEALLCVITGYDGKTVGEFQAKQANGEAELTVRLPRGFYTLSFPHQNQTFGVVAMPPHEGEKDRFFAIDAALSIFRPLPVRAELIRALDRMGVATARERLLWGDVQTSKKTWDWVTKKQYEPTRRLYSESHIGVLELFHAAPAWMQTDKRSVFPEDLPASEKAWEQIAARWGVYWGGLEVWNEADIPAGQGGPQAEQYLPVIKTVRYALQSAGCAAPIGGGVFAYLTRPYMDLAAENGLLEASDFLSFHYYSEPQGLESYIAEYRRYLEDFGKETMPLWLSECGAPWLGNGNLRPPVEDDRAAADAFAKLAVEAKACGIERYFPFVLVAYTEHGNKNFGMLDRQESPVRSMAAYAQVIDALSHAEYAGDLQLPDPAVRARVFARADGSAVVALESGTSRDARVDLPFPVTEVRGIDGRKLDWANPGTIADGVCFAFAAMREVAPHLKSETRAMELFRLAHAPAQARKAASPIILAPSVNAAEFTAGIRGYEVPDAAKELPVKVRVTNLSPKPQSLRVTIEGNAQAPAENGRVVRQLTVPAESSADVTASVPRSAVAFDSQGRGKVRFTAEGNEAGDILPATLFFATPLGLEQCLGTHAYRFALPIGDITRWEKNSSGTLEFGSSPQGAWKFHVVYGPGDKWAFPKFIVPQEVDLDRLTGVVVRARCQRPATVRLMTWPRGKTNLSTTGYSIVKPDGEWHVAYVPFSDFLKTGEKPGRQIGKISVGVSDRDNPENSLEMSDLIFVGE